MVIPSRSARRRIIRSWSVDRQEFVQAGSLEIGERLQTLSGDVKVVQQKLPRPGPQPVFNLEVHNEHVYFVGEDGVLVHNSCDNVLVVGEAASLEYSIALARANPNMRVTATSLHGLATVDGIPQNLRVIQHSVDATSLGKHFKGETFGSVVFNGPAAHPKSKTGQLIDDALSSAIDVLDEGGSIRFSSGFGLPSSRRLHKLRLAPGDWSIEYKKFFDDPLGVKYSPVTNEGMALDRGARKLFWYIFNKKAK